jgi:hypothetical protein
MTLMLLLVLYPVAGLGRMGFNRMASGEMARHVFNPQYDLGALDQGPLLQMGYYIFAVDSLFAFPFVVLARFVSDRSTRLGYWGVLLPVLAIAICLVLFLIPNYYLLLQYIELMGMAPGRRKAVIFTLFAAAMLLATVCWVAIPPPAAGPGEDENAASSLETAKGPEPEGSGPSQSL